jgi:hypothetical protein
MLLKYCSKIFFLILISSYSIIGYAQGTIVFSESFNNYSNGNLHGNGGGEGWAGTWAGGDNQVINSLPGTSCKGVQISSSNGVTSRNLSSLVNAGGSTTYYLSFVFNANPFETGYAGITLVSTLNGTGNLFVGMPGGSSSLGFDWNSEADGLMVASPNTNYLCLVKIEKAPDNINTRVSMFATTDLNTSGSALSGTIPFASFDGTGGTYTYNKVEISGDASLVCVTGLTMATTADLAVNTTQTALPVTWQSFTVEKSGAASLLKWSTGSEQNTKDYEVQHSTNTINWSPLGTMAAAGNSTTTRNYSFFHNTPFKGNIYNYYRILQRDLDGKFSFSKIASLVYDEPGSDVIVYPNPASGTITIYLAESSEVKLVNVAGATIWRGTLTAGRNQISLSHFIKGVYWVVTEKYKKQLLIQ